MLSRPRPLSILMFSSLLMACGPAAAPPDELEPESSARQDIVGGSQTSDFPAAGALTRFGYPHCTGTLVSPRTVLTAAHCLEGVSAASLRFVIGADVGAPEAVLYVAAVTPHPDYDAVKLANDIGFVTLTDDAPVAPMKLVSGMTSGWVGRELTFVGYGITKGYGGGSGVKRSVVMPIHSVGSTSFVYQTPGKNTCNGDSGGPAFALVGSEWQVAGVTSYGDAGCNYYGVDTRADVYADFVLGSKDEPAADDPGNDDPCQGETWEGRCDGSTVIWCENQSVKQLSCNTCGFDQQSGYYNCL